MGGRSFVPGEMFRPRDVRFTLVESAQASLSIRIPGASFRHGRQYARRQATIDSTEREREREKGAHNTGKDMLEDPVESDP